MRNRSTVKSDIAEEGDVGRKASNLRCTDAPKSEISQSVISKLLSADLAQKTAPIFRGPSPRRGKRSAAVTIRSVKENMWR
jgi:hypothetical protein